MYRFKLNYFSDSIDAIKANSTFVKTRLLKNISVVFITLLFSNTAYAFEDLNEAQTLIYDTAHLANTEAKSTIIYEYTFTDKSSGETVEDKVKLTITNEHDESNRDVSIDFLSEDRKIHLPNFKNRRGNPVIIGMLEHLAQNMGQLTGGGALYFRNRIKDKLAEESLAVSKNEGLLSFSIRPLQNDPYVAERAELTESVITIAFNTEIAGQLHSIEYVSGPSEDPVIQRKLEYSGVETSN